MHKVGLLLVTYTKYTYFILKVIVFYNVEYLVLPNNNLFSTSSLSRTERHKTITLRLKRS